MCLHINSKSRLYTAVGDYYVETYESPMDYIPDIEINPNEDSLCMAIVGPYFNQYKAYCSMKHISDSFYMINSNPKMSQFADMKINVYRDSTLDRRVRVTLMTKHSFSEHNSPVTMFDNTVHLGGHCDLVYATNGICVWEYYPENEGCSNKTSYFNIDFSPKYWQVMNNQLLDKLMGMDYHDYRLSIKYDSSFYTHQNSIVIELPNFSTEIFNLYYIPNEIIILTDNKLVWNGITYRRSRFNSFKEKQQNIDSLKPWPWMWRSRPNNCY